MTDHKKLVNAYFDGEISKGDSEELSAWIASDPENAVYFAKEAQKHQGLRDIFSSEAAAAVKPGSDRMRRVSRRGRSTARRKFNPAWIAAAAAACIALIIGIRLYKPEPPAVPSQIKIGILLETGLNTSVERNGETVQAQDGMEIFPGDIITAGLNDDTYFEKTGSMTAIGMEPGSILRMPSKDELAYTVEKGKVRCIVETQDKGKTFSVKTRVALVSVVGTVFTVDDRQGLSEIRVENGTVRVAARTGGESLLVNAGETATVKGSAVALVKPVPVENVPEPEPEAVPEPRPEPEVRPEPVPETKMVWKTVLTDDFSAKLTDIWEFRENFSENSGTVIDANGQTYRAVAGNGFLRFYGKNADETPWLQAAAVSKQAFAVRKGMRVTVEFERPVTYKKGRFYGAVRIRGSRTHNLTDKPQIMFMFGADNDRIALNNNDSDNSIWESSRRSEKGTIHTIIFELDLNTVTAWFDGKKVLDNYRYGIWLGDSVLQLDAGSRDLDKDFEVRYKSVKVEQMVPAVQDGSGGAE